MYSKQTPLDGTVVIGSIAAFVYIRVNTDDKQGCATTNRQIDCSVQRVRRV